MLDLVLGGVLEAFWERLGGSWRRLGSVLGRLGASWGRLGRILVPVGARGAQACSTKQAEEKRWNSDKETHAREQRERGREENRMLLHVNFHLNALPVHLPRQFFFLSFNRGFPLKMVPEGS